jgi:hypothetical protein
MYLNKSRYFLTLSFFFSFFSFLSALDSKLFVMNYSHEQVNKQLNTQLNNAAKSVGYKPRKGKHMTFLEMELEKADLPLVSNALKKNFITLKPQFSHFGTVVKRTQLYLAKTKAFLNKIKHTIRKRSLYNQALDNYKKAQKRLVKEISCKNRLNGRQGISVPYNSVQPLGQFVAATFGNTSKLQAIRDSLENAVIDAYRKKYHNIQTVTITKNNVPHKQIKTRGKVLAEIRKDNPFTPHVSFIKIDQQKPAINLNQLQAQKFNDFVVTDNFKIK